MLCYVWTSCNLLGQVESRSTGWDMFTSIFFLSHMSQTHAQFPAYLDEVEINFDADVGLDITADF
jgi:hypothetical protein